MKKVLAVILTIAMLASMLVTGAFAASREVYQDDPTTDHYWYFGPGNSWHPVKFDNPSNTVEMDIKLDKNSKGDSGLGCFSTSNAPSITLTSVGVTAATVPYNFATDTWYHIKWDSNGSTTDIYVDGALVGTASAALTYYSGNQFYWQPIEMAMDNVAVGGQVFDFEGDNSRWNTESGQGELEAREVETYRADLGAHYWYFSPGNSWHPVVFDNPGKTIEMDIKLDGADSSLGCYGLSNAPSMGINYVGLKDASISLEYNFKAETWYHIKWKTNSAGTKTTIYVDGNKIGTVAAGISYYSDNQFYWAPDKLAMDNVSMGGQKFDFEGDVSRWNSESGQGELVDYDLTVKGDSIFDHFPTYEVGGEAFLEEAAWDETFLYFYHPGMSPRGNNFIMNFDLALLPNTESADGTYIELWTNSASRRFKVGTKFVGRDDDLADSNWGEATVTNFHNVTYYMNQSVQKAQIYIDQVLVYEGASGTTWDSCFIGGIWNGSAIIDNYHVYTLDYEEVPSNMWSDRPDFQASVNLDAADFCASNVHVAGITTQTVEQSCVNYGEKTTVCAVCGNVKETHVVPMNAHKWKAYDINRTADGLVYTECWTCGGRRYTTLPESGTYTGNIYEYYDMNDDMVLVIDNGWSTDTWTQADGLLKFGTSTNNYNYFSVVRNIPLNNWSWNLDIVYNGIFSSSDAERKPDGRPGYGHVLYFWFGGSDTITLQAGYNADENKLFIIPNNGNPNQDNPFPNGAIQAKTADFTMVPGEAYNIQLSVYYDDNENSDTYGDTSVKLIVNGVTYVEFSNADDEYALFVVQREGEHQLGTPILRDFGVNFDVDAMAFASANFAYTNRAYNGDLDGDYALTAADALLMRKYLARVIGDADILTSRADANADGAVNAKDQLVIRKALMA